MLDVVHVSGPLDSGLDDIASVIATYPCLVPAGYLPIVTGQQDDPEVVVPDFLCHEYEA